MPRYFFDIHDHHKSNHDEEGLEFSDLEAVRLQAMRILPEIAKDEVPADGDRQTFTVMVTDEDGKPVYSAALNFTGMWLLR